MTKRAVLYARVSSDDWAATQGRNLESQLEMCRQHALSRGWIVIAELAEDERGASGASLDLEKLSQVLDMARASEFDVLVVREIDRFARSLAKQLIVEQQLKQAGVRIEYVLGEYPDTPEGNLMKNVKASVAEYERLKIAERMSRGRRNSVKAGSVLVYGKPPYGYRSVEREGKWTLEIYEPEARIVRMFFTWYVEGAGDGKPLTITGLARKLTEMGIPTRVDAQPSSGAKKRGQGQWSRSSIYGMLRNETCVGIWRYGKRGKKDGHRPANPSSEHLTLQVPAIVSRDLWDQVQQRLEHNRRQSPRRRKRNYLLSGRVTCGVCGLKMVGNSTKPRGKVRIYYRCHGSTKYASYVRTCNLPQFDEDRVDTVVWEWIKRQLCEEEPLEQGLKEYQALRESKRAPLVERLRAIEGLIEENQAQLGRLLDLYMKGEFPREILADRRIRLEKTVAALEKERALLSADLEQTEFTDDQVKDITAFAAEVRSKLDTAGENLAVRRRIIELLDVQVTLTVEDLPEGSKGKVVYVSCVLGDSSFSLRPSPSVVQ